MDNNSSGCSAPGKGLESNIPSREGFWKHPSYNQFYKATTRKGKTPLHSGNEVDKKLIPHIVEIHNQVNMEAWKRVIEYEDLHDCVNPFLSHFSNNNKKLSFKARALGWLGYDPPFDRHDWLIDRCGKQVKYIIDFYNGVPKADSDNKITIHIDARPSPTIEGIIDRFRLSFKKLFNNKL